MDWIIEARGRVLSRHGSLREALKAADGMGRRLSWAVIRSTGPLGAARRRPQAESGHRAPPVSSNRATAA